MAGPGPDPNGLSLPPLLLHVLSGQHWQQQQCCQTLKNCRGKTETLLACVWWCGRQPGVPPLCVGMWCGALSPIVVWWNVECCGNCVIGGTLRWKHTSIVDGLCPGSWVDRQCAAPERVTYVELKGCVSVAVQDPSTALRMMVVWFSLGLFEEEVFAAMLKGVLLSVSQLWVR